MVKIFKGTGLLGMLSYRLGAKYVLLTDNDEKSLNHMKDDVVTNKVTADIACLDWFHFSGNDIQLGSECDTVIIAGDDLYKAMLLEPFFNTVATLFSHFKNVKMLLCHIPRAGVAQEIVQEHMKTKADIFKYEIIDPELWRKGCCTENCPSEDYNRAFLYQLTKV